MNENLKTTPYKAPYRMFYKIDDLSNILSSSDINYEVFNFCPKKGKLNIRLLYAIQASNKGKI